MGTVGISKVICQDGSWGLRIRPFTLPSLWDLPFDREMLVFEPATFGMQDWGSVTEPSSTLGEKKTERCQENWESLKLREPARTSQKAKDRGYRNSLTWDRYSKWGEWGWQKENWCATYLLPSHHWDGLNSSDVAVLSLLWSWAMLVALWGKPSAQAKSKRALPMLRHWHSSHYDFLHILANEHKP